MPAAKTISTIPIDEKPRLNTAEASVYLERCHGIRVAAQTLTRLRCEGKGPLFTKPMKVVIYAKTDLDAWADQKNGRAVRTTAQLSEVLPPAARA